MGLRLRKTVRLGPVRLHFTEHGFTSWSVRLGPFTWNSKRGESYDLPGAFSWRRR